MTRDEARTRTIESHLELIDRVLRATQTGRNMEPDDRRQVAALGLIWAVDHYGEGQEIPFEVYAFSAMRSQLFNAAQRHAGLKRVPHEPLYEESLVAPERGERAALARHERAEALHELADGLAPRPALVVRSRLRGASHGAIAEALGVSWDHVRRIEEAAIRRLREFFEAGDPAGSFSIRAAA